MTAEQAQHLRRLLDEVVRASEGGTVVTVDRASFAAWTRWLAESRMVLNVIAQTEGPLEVVR